MVGPLVGARRICEASPVAERTSVTVVRGWGHAVLGVLVIALGGLVVGDASGRPVLLALGFGCTAAGLLLVLIGAVAVGIQLAGRGKDEAPGAVEAGTRRMRRVARD